MTPVSDFIATLYVEFPQPIRSRCLRVLYKTNTKSVYCTKSEIPLSILAEEHSRLSTMGAAMFSEYVGQKLTFSSAALVWTGW